MVHDFHIQFQCLTVEIAFHIWEHLQAFKMWQYLLIPDRLRWLSKAEQQKDVKKSKAV